MSIMKVVDSGVYPVIGVDIDEYGDPIPPHKVSRPAAIGEFPDLIQDFGIELARPASREAFRQRITLAIAPAIIVTRTDLSTEQLVKEIAWMAYRLSNEGAYPEESYET